MLFVKKYAITINIAGANRVPERKALAGALADCNLTIMIPMIEAIKPIEVKANGNIIISFEPNV
jgi:hypothetical protein